MIPKDETDEHQTEGVCGECGELRVLQDQPLGWWNGYEPRRVCESCYEALMSALEE